MERVNNADNNRYNAAIRLVERLPGAVPLSVHQHSVTYPSLGIIQGDKIPLRRVTGQCQRLYDQQTPLLVIRVADRGYDGANNFAKCHNQKDIAINMKVRVILSLDFFHPAGLFKCT